MRGLHLAEILETPGVSGAKALSARPTGARLLALARKSKPVDVVAKFDRLFRSVAAAAQTIVDFDRMGIELVAITESFDMTNPHGRAMAHMASVFAELERAMIRVRTRAAMRVKRGRGERISGHAAYGCDFGPDGARIENALEQKVIAWIQVLHDEGKSLRVIADMLNDHGVAPKRAKRWLHSSVLRIVSRVALMQLAFRFSLTGGRHGVWSWLPDCEVAPWTSVDDRLWWRQHREQARLEIGKNYPHCKCIRSPVDLAGERSDCN